jgi:hypothetical protein
VDAEDAFLQGVGLSGRENFRLAEMWLKVALLPVRGRRLLRQVARCATRVALAPQDYGGDVEEAVAEFLKVTNGGVRNSTHKRKHARTDTRAPAAL